MRLTVALLAVAAMGAACASTPEQVAERQAREAQTLAHIEAHRGEETNRLCFTRSIDSYRAIDNDHLLLRESINDWYLLELSGTCRPQWAFNAISVRSRGASSCLTRGDRVETHQQGLDGTCFITRIYHWNEGGNEAVDAYE